MMQIKKMFVILILTLFSLNSFAQQAPLSERPEWAGVYYNNSGTLPDFTGFEEGFVGRAARVKWRDIQPSYNKYDFSTMIEQLRHAADNDYYYYFELWTGWHSPAWISDPAQVGENTVPWVALDDWPDTPYYLDEDYKVYIKAMFDKLVETFASLPEDVLEHMPFIQIGLGSTGDRKLYKKPNLDPQYDISDDEFVAYKKEITSHYISAFASNPKTAHIRFLWNINDYDGIPVKASPSKFDRFALWVRTNYNAQLRKIQFPYAIGYGSPGEKTMFEEHMPFFYGAYGSPYGSGGRWGGKPEFIRGEYNEGETAPTWMHQNNPAVHYYWTALTGVYSGFDAWETKEPSAANKEALEFSNKYAYHKDPAKSPYAFVAFRDVLDYSDKVRFPVENYGSATRSNVTRVQNILNEFAAYGAANDDMSAATTLNLATYLKESKGYNDCLWDVDANNCSRFITQIDARNTSVAYWHVGVTQTQPYGRYCRGFDMANNKNTMYFDVHDKYFSSSRAKGDGRLKVKIIHYAKDGGSWEFQYHAQDGSMKSIEVINDASKDWVTTEFDLTDAILFNGGGKGADLILQNKGNTNCRFHLIELAMPGPPATVEGVSIKTITTTPLAVGAKLQLEAVILPANADNTDVRWEVVAGDAVTVDQNGLLTAIAEGTAIVNVTTRDGGFSDTCAIKAGETNYTLENVPGLNFDIEDQTAMYKDTTETSEENEYYKIKGFNIKWSTLSGLHFDVENSGLAPGEGVNSSQAFKMKFSGARGTGIDMVLITDLVDISDRGPGDYEFTFSAKSLNATSGTPINLVVNTYDVDGTNVSDATCIRNERIVSLTSDYKTQRISFTVKANTSGGNDAKYAKLTMQSGKYDNTYWFDNFKLTTFVDAVIPPGLSGIKIDNVPYKWFHPEIYNYDVELPYGTLDLPVVTSDTTESVETISISNITSLPGTATVYATFKDGSDAIYTINFSVSDKMPSSDADLLDLKVNGIMLTGFDAGVKEYNVALPYVTVEVPYVTATASDENASVEISGSSSLPGSKIITVRAEDGTTSKTYTLNFTVAPSFDASLSGLSLNDSPVSNFSANTELYYIELPEGTTDVPEVKATATDENADVQITNAASLPGSTSVLVTAEDDVTTKTYTINFTVDPSNVSPGASDPASAKIYPNPVEEFLNIEFATTGKRKIDLYNTVGQLIYSVQTHTATTVIDIKTLNIEGLVTLRIETDSSAKNHKVIVR